MQRNHEAVTRQLSSLENQTQAVQQQQTYLIRFMTSYMRSFGKQLIESFGKLAALGVGLSTSMAQVVSVVVSLSDDVGSIRASFMRLERPMADEHFILEDYTGRTLPIYLKTVASWEVFEFILCDRFKGRKGARRVSNGRYLLKEHATRRDLDRSKAWEDAFLPNQKVDMSMICREIAAEDTQLSACPRCSEVSSETSNDDDEVQW